MSEVYGTLLMAGRVLADLLGEDGCAQLGVTQLEPLDSAIEKAQEMRARGFQTIRIRVVDAQGRVLGLLAGPEYALMSVHVMVA